MTDDWRAMIRLGVEELVDKAVTRGAKQSDVYAISAPAPFEWWSSMKRNILRDGRQSLP
jgi:hypothetical protein